MAAIDGNYISLTDGKGFTISNADDNTGKCDVTITGREVLYARYYIKDGSTAPDAPTTLTIVAVRGDNPDHFYSITLRAGDKRYSAWYALEATVGFNLFFTYVTTFIRQP